MSAGQNLSKKSLNHDGQMQLQDKVLR